MKTRLLPTLAVSLIATFLATSAPAADLRQGLVAYWPLDETPDGVIAPDLTPYGNHLNLISIDSSNFVPGRHGNAVSFNGTDELLSRVYSDDTGLPVYRARRWTVMMWVNGVGSTQPQDRRVFAEGSTASNNPLFTLGTDSNASATTRTNVVDVFVRDTAGAAPLNHVKSTRMAFDGTWHHLAWVEDDGVGRLYIDGELDPVVFNNTRAALDLNTVAIGGIQRAAPSSYFTGLIDEVALWERNLSQAEIQQVMNNRIETPIPDLPPTITLEPRGGTRAQGDRFTLNSWASGNRPLNFQWFRNGHEIPGAASNVLVLTDLTDADSGDYTVQVSNFDGTATSSPARLTVAPDPEPDVRRGLISYWPFNEVSTDDLGNSTTPDLYSRNSMRLANMDFSNLTGGVFGDALNFDGVEEYTSRVGGSPISLNPAYSVSFWVNANGLGQSDRRVFAEGATNNGNPLLNLGTHATGADATLTLFIRNNSGTVLLNRRSTTPVFDGMWHHVVWTETNGQGRLYVDGMFDPTDFTYTRSLLTPHTTTVGGILRAAPSHWFAGVVDEVALWDRRLTYAEIESLRTNGVPPPLAVLPPNIVRHPAGAGVFAGETVALTVNASGTQPLFFQWQRDGRDVEDATNSIFLLENIGLHQAGVYAVLVTNEAGRAFSSNAEVRVLPVADITTGLLAYWPLDTLTDITPDLTPNGNLLTAANLDANNLVPGLRGNAVTLDGVEEILTRQNTNGFGLPVSSYRAYTVALWVNGNGVGQLDRRIFSEGSTTNNSPLLNLGTDNTGATASLDVFIRNNDGGTPLNHLKSTAPVLDGVWHHLAWVDNDGMARLYIDGVQDATDFSYGRGLLTPNTLSLGGITRATNSHWFTGTIDDVALWRRGLTAEEVQYVMTHGPTPLRITGLRLLGNDVVLSLLTPNPGGAHRLEATADLSAPVWSEVQGANFSAPEGNQLTVTFARPAGSKRFFRVLLPP